MRLFHIGSCNGQKQFDHSEEVELNAAAKDFYKSDFKKSFKFNISSMKNFRKIKSSFDFKLYELVKYPKNPTHLI